MHVSATRQSLIGEREQRGGTGRQHPVSLEAPRYKPLRLPTLVS
jgi:hypothetical protein